MGCGESKDASGEAIHGGRRVSLDSITSWKGDRNKHWQALFLLDEDKHDFKTGEYKEKIVEYPEELKEPLTTDFGDGRLGTRDYQSAVDFVSLLGQGELYDDTAFDATNESAFFHGSENDVLQWKRSTEISSEPQLMVKGIESTDVRAGRFGNHWFLQPLAAIAGLRPDILREKVLPPPQPLLGDDFHGGLTFSFWRFGEWVNVWVDDRFPVDAEGALTMAHSKDKDEFWVAMLEKAYAKLHGCFENISWGHPADALVDLTGGFVERYSIKDGIDPTLYRKIGRAIACGAFVACFRKDAWINTFERYKKKRVAEQLIRTQAEEEDQLEDLSDAEDAANDATENMDEQADDMEEKVHKSHRRASVMKPRCVHCGRTNHKTLDCPRAPNKDRRVSDIRQDSVADENGSPSDGEKEIIEVNPKGLDPENLYTVTDVRRIQRCKGTEMLIRVKNLWGNKDEWEGPWADGDSRWSLVDKKTKKDMTYQDKPDGEFWMTFKDFSIHFNEILVCSVPDENGHGSQRSATGQWTAGLNAGGCHNDIDSFSTNPQFTLEIEADTGKGDQDKTQLGKDGPNNAWPESTVSVVVSLMQEHRRSIKEEAMKMRSIGFVIYPVFEGEDRLWTYGLKKSLITANMAVQHTNIREVTARFDVYPKQKYVIVPSTFNQNEETEFLLRVTAAHGLSLTECEPYDGNKDYMDMQEKLKEEKTDEDEADEETNDNGDDGNDNAGGSDNDANGNDNDNDNDNDNNNEDNNEN